MPISVSKNRSFVRSSFVRSLVVRSFVVLQILILPRLGPGSARRYGSGPTAGAPALAKLKFEILTIPKPARSIDQSINRSIDQSIDRSIDQSINRSINRTTNERTTTNDHGCSSEFMIENSLRCKWSFSKRIFQLG